jgi:hemerythrin-like domain-containing protein
MTDIHQRLAEDHRRLDALLEALSKRAADGDDETKRAALADFESALVAHLEGEEKHLFPRLEAEFPEEVLALREEHEAIRRQVSEVVDSEHIDRLEADRAARLVATLRKHAQRENTMLYTLVNDRSGSKRYRELVTYLERTYERLRADE